MADLKAVINFETEASNDTNVPDMLKTPTTSEGQEGPSISSEEPRYSKIGHQMLDNTSLGILQMDFTLVK